MVECQHSQPEVWKQRLEARAQHSTVPSHKPATWAELTSLLQRCTWLYICMKLTTFCWAVLLHVSLFWWDCSLSGFWPSVAHSCKYCYKEYMLHCPDTVASYACHLCARATLFLSASLQLQQTWSNLSMACTSSDNIFTRTGITSKMSGAAMAQWTLSTTCCWTHPQSQQQSSCVKSKPS